MTGAAAPRMDDARIAPMHDRKRAPQPVGVGRHQDQMDMIGHQAPGPHLDTGGATMLRQEIAVELVIVIAEESACTPVSALRDKMGKSGDDEAGETSHVPSWPQQCSAVN